MTTGERRIAKDANRLPGHPDWFVSAWQDGVHVSRIWAPAEPLLDLFVELAQLLAVGPDQALDIVVADHRQHRRWSGARRDLPGVCDAITAAKLAVARFGGVEVSLTTATDQLVLTPELLCVIYARTPHWPFLLESRGLVERATLPAPTWRPWKAPRRPAPLLTEAVLEVVRALELVEVDA